MTKLTKKNQIWTIKPTEEDIWNAIEYAKKSLNWTFNRMGKQGKWSWYNRMMRILFGVLGQNSLIKEVNKRCKNKTGKTFTKDWNDYRSEDAFDLFLPNNEHLLDLKCFNHFPDKDDPKIRPPFSLDYFIKNISYAGADYRKFFPCLIPADQFRTKKTPKDYYSFGVISSPNYISNKKDYNRQDHFLISSFMIQTGSMGHFLMYKKLIQEREKEGRGFDITLHRKAMDLLNEPISLSLGYEKEGGFHEDKFELKPNEKYEVNDISGVSFLRIRNNSIKKSLGEIVMQIRNNFTRPVYNYKRLNINKLPDKGKYVFKPEDFADLFPPGPINIYFIGFISHNDFKKCMKDYHCWVHPIDKESKYLNRKGTPNIPGFMHPRSTCYIYPNIYRGGLQNKNNYVLPKDLTNMDEICTIL